MRRLGFAGGTVALVVIALAGCGSSEPTAEEEARDAAVEILEGTDQRQFCREQVTDRYLREGVGGGVAICEKASLISKDPGDVRATKVAVRGPDEVDASVAVAVRGGELDGVSGTVELAKEDDDWRLDGYGDDMLRSSFQAAIRLVDEGALSTDAMKACVGNQAEKLSAARIRTVNRDAATDQKAFLENDILPLAENCHLALAEYAAGELTKGLVKAGKSPAYVSCLHEELTGLLLLTDITPELLLKNSGFAPVAALEGIVVAAKENCIGKD